MADRRKITRAQAKFRTAAARRIAQEQGVVRAARIAASLSTARTVVADSTFTDLIRAHGIQSLPRPLLMRDAPDHETGKALTSGKEHVSDCALEFAVAWRFFAPLLIIPALVTHLDARWPGFTLELRDVFISLVADGPFPYQHLGRGRRTI
jgi:hypothetical protein